MALQLQEGARFHFVGELESVYFYIALSVYDHKPVVCQTKAVSIKGVSEPFLPSLFKFRWPPVDPRRVFFGGKQPNIV